MQSHPETELIPELVAASRAPDGFRFAVPANSRQLLEHILRAALADAGAVREYEKSLAIYIRDNQLLPLIVKARDEACLCLRCPLLAGLERLSDAELVCLALTPGYLSLFRDMICDAFEIGEVVAPEWDAMRRHDATSGPSAPDEELQHSAGESGRPSPSTSSAGIVSAEVTKLVSPVALEIAVRVGQLLWSSQGALKMDENSAATACRAAHFRGVNESMATQRVASNPDRAWRKAIADCLAKLSTVMLERATDNSFQAFIEYLACDIEWHLTVLEKGQIPYAAKSFPDAYCDLNLAVKNLLSAPRRARSADEHREQEGLILKGDWKEASRRALDHLETAAENEFLRQNVATRTLLDLHVDIRRLSEVAPFNGEILYRGLRAQDLYFWWWGWRPGPSDPEEWKKHDRVEPIESKNWTEYGEAFCHAVKSGAWMAFFVDEDDDTSWFENLLDQINERLPEISLAELRRRVILFRLPQACAIPWEEWSGTFGVFVYRALKLEMLTHRPEAQNGQIDALIYPVDHDANNLRRYNRFIRMMLQKLAASGAEQSDQAAQFLTRFDEATRDVNLPGTALANFVARV